MKLQRDEKGLFVLVGLDRLQETCDCLTRIGVEFYEDTESSSSCAGPVVGVIRFANDLDQAQLESQIDSCVS